MQGESMCVAGSWR